MNYELGYEIAARSSQPLSDLHSEVIDFAAPSQSFEAVWTLQRKDLVVLGVIRQIRGRRAADVAHLSINAAYATIAVCDIILP